MTKDVLQELQEALEMAGAARNELACLVRHLNTPQAKELAAKFAEVLPKECDLDICGTHLLHAAVIMLLDSMYKMRGISRSQWVDGYAGLIHCLNIEVQIEVAEKEKKSEEAPRTDEKEATVETN